MRTHVHAHPMQNCKAHKPHLWQINRAIVSANALKGDMKSLLLQQLRTQVSATLATPQLADGASLALGELRAAAGQPTEELLGWAMGEKGHHVKDALALVQEKSKICTELANEASVHQLRERLDGQSDGHGINEMLGGLVRLAMQLSGYQAGSAAALLADDHWVQSAIVRCARGCYIPGARNAEQTHVKAPVFAGIGSDFALAPIAYNSAFSASSSQQKLVKAPAGSKASKAGVRLIGAMLHAMNHTSLSLATDLMARRMYMRSKQEEQPWTAEEDGMLVQWVEAALAKAPMAALKWDRAPLVTGRDGGRTMEQCRTRWEAVLSPKIREGSKEARSMASRLTRPTRLVYDPRFLVFEFLLGFMLRRRQFELVSEFAQAAIEGRSSVNQMIMGQGKTTVSALTHDHAEISLATRSHERIHPHPCPGHPHAMPIPSPRHPSAMFTPCPLP